MNMSQEKSNIVELYEKTINRWSRVHIPVNLIGLRACPFCMDAQRRCDNRNTQNIVVNTSKKIWCDDYDPSKDSIPDRCFYCIIDKRLCDGLDNGNTYYDKIIASITDDKLFKKALRRGKRFLKRIAMKTYWREYLKTHLIPFIH